MTITGNLDAEGEIQIEGEVNGDIHTARIMVGEQGNITGANDIIVRGTVSGSIKGDNGTIQANSHIEGDNFHKLLAIEQGAYFDGRARRQTADELAWGISRLRACLTFRREIAARNAHRGGPFVTTRDMGGIGAGEQQASTNHTIAGAAS